MNTTASGTDGSVQRHVSQTTLSSVAKLDIGTVTTPSQRIIYTTAQLHEIEIVKLIPIQSSWFEVITVLNFFTFLFFLNYAIFVAAI